MRTYKVSIKSPNYKGLVEIPYLLSGLFTSKYEDEFMLHYICPLCSDQMNVRKKLEYIKGLVTVNYESEVWGDMNYELKEMLHKHYPYECGTTREHRNEGARVLLDKYMDEVYK